MCIFRVTIVGLIPSGGAKTFEFKPVKGRYVNIFLPGHGKYLTLCEVQVFAGKGKTQRSNVFTYFVLCTKMSCSYSFLHNYFLTAKKTSKRSFVLSECSSLL